MIPRTADAAAASTDSVPVEPERATVPVDKAPSEAAPQQPALHLTYEPSRRFRLPRWAARAIVLLAILLVAGVSLTAFMLRLTEPGQEKSVQALMANGAARPRALSAPAAPAMAYTADPQETKSSQVITVAAMPGQTLEEISLLYVGHFDAELLQQISALNPELKDLSHLDPGQLIRLPLPPGSFRKREGPDFGEVNLPRAPISRQANECSRSSATCSRAFPSCRTRACGPCHFSECRRARRR